MDTKYKQGEGKVVCFGTGGGWMRMTETNSRAQWRLEKTEVRTTLPRQQIIQCINENGKHKSPN